MKAPDHVALGIVSAAITVGVFWLFGALTKPTLIGGVLGVCIGTAINVWRGRRAAR